MATVLIIEDEMSMAELIRERLGDKGYKTVIAYTGGKGLEIANTQNPDVITLDIYLPDMNGVEVLKMLKMDKDKSSIPVIVITSDDTLEKECKGYKADEFVKKPINFKKLEEIMKLATQKKTS